MPSLRVQDLKAASGSMFWAALKELSLNCHDMDRYIYIYTYIYIHMYMYYIIGFLNYGNSCQVKTLNGNPTFLDSGLMP